MPDSNIYISHNSALHFWRTNPPWYVLEGSDRNIRALRNCPASELDLEAFYLNEAEFGPDPIDVLVPPSGPRFRTERLHYHVQKAALPPHSLYPLRDGIHIVSPELCFVQLCNELEIFDALKLGMELCGTYALRPDSMAKRDYELTDAASLQRKVSMWHDIHGLGTARLAVRQLISGAASPMETAVYLLLCLPPKYGGYSIPRPRLNPEQEVPPELVASFRGGKIYPDFLWKPQRLVLEYDGEYHNDPDQATRDELRKVTLEMMGYEVRRIKKRQLYDPIAFDSFAQSLARRLGKRLAQTTRKQTLARDALRATLLD